MNQAHIHLVITHLPIFGTILGAFVLAFGILSKSAQTQISAFLLFVISGIGAGIAYLTGEGAEEVVENVQGISENVIEQHEAFAIVSLVAIILLSILSLISIFFVKSSRLSNVHPISKISLLASLVCFGLIARTGYLGGKIRHTETSNASAYIGVEQGGEEDDD
ncbi:MAG: hypothetical protein K1X55_17885 [Chitinophagales bacterium]|nr:hypothetical protein [Chitinophagales bacterium]